MVVKVKRTVRSEFVVETAMGRCRIQDEINGRKRRENKKRGKEVRDMSCR